MHVVKLSPGPCLFFLRWQEETTHLHNQACVCGRERHLRRERGGGRWRGGGRQRLWLGVTDAPTARRSGWEGRTLRGLRHLKTFFAKPMY